MFCQSCGNQIRDGVKFCPMCGSATAPAQPQPVGFQPAQGFQAASDLQPAEPPKADVRPAPVPVPSRPTGSYQPTPAYYPLQSSTTAQPKKKKTALLIALLALLACGVTVLVLFLTGVFGNKNAVANSKASPNTISAGPHHCVAVKEDGTVVSAGDNYHGECDVYGWTDIKAVSAGYNHTLGLRSDGTVVAAGSNEYGECEVYGWTNIVAISAGYDFSLGLRKDGTVVFAGRNDEYVSSNVVSGWTDIVAIDNDYMYAYGLKSDGTAVFAGFDIYDYVDRSEWQDLAAFDCSYEFGPLGLKKDGTVVADESFNVSEWNNISAIDVDGGWVYGLKKDGTVVVAVNDYCGERFDDNRLNQIRSWRNIVSISGGNGADCYILALKSDGTVAYVGYDANIKAAVESWDHIKR